MYSSQFCNKNIHKHYNKSNITKSKLVLTLDLNNVYRIDISCDPDTWDSKTYRNSKKCTISSHIAKKTLDAKLLKSMSNRINTIHTFSPFIDKNSFDPFSRSVRKLSIYNFIFSL